MMNPSTYKKIAVASTFSPRFEQVLSEAGRICERFGSTLNLIYIAERTDANTDRAPPFSGERRASTVARSDLFRASFHESRAQTEAAAPDRFCRELFRPRPTRVSTNAQAGGGGI